MSRASFLRALVDGSTYEQAVSIVSHLSAVPAPLGDRRKSGQDARTGDHRNNSHGALEIVKRRNAPTLYIIDEQFRVVLTRSSRAPFIGESIVVKDDGHLPDHVESVVRLLVESQDEAEDDPLIALLSPRVLVRVVPLEGPAGRHHAIMLERYEARAGLATAGERFGLSPREVEVLRHLVKGDSTVEIAAALHIAETTVQDHVKRLSSKMNARKRTEIVARALGSN